jgi:peptide/nickel transport system permease protein
MATAGGLPSIVRALVGRVFLAALLILAAASTVWLVTSLVPGDATMDPTISEEQRLAERHRLGLDRPLSERYVEWLGRAVRFDLGTSITYRQPVTPLVVERAANTALLALTALFAATLVALPLGVIGGSGRWPWLSSLVSGASIVTLSMPPLLTSLVLAMLAARTGWLPTSGMSGLDAPTLPLGERLVDLARHLFLPALALALPLGAALERLQAAAVAEGRRERYVLAARGRGLPFSRILVGALWRPTVAPVASLFALAAGTLLSESLAVEVVSAWPGLGRLMFEALGGRDPTLAAGCGAAAAAFLAAWNALGDLAVRTLDPRTRAEPGA